MAQRKNVRIVHNNQFDLLLHVAPKDSWVVEKIPAWTVEILAPGIGYWTAYGAPTEHEAKNLRRLILKQHPEWTQKTIGTRYPGDS